MKVVAIPSEQASTDEPRGGDSRGKAIVFRGKRFVVHAWMLDDFKRALGKNYIKFNIQGWFKSLDKWAESQSAVIPRLEQRNWLERELQRECQRRGLKKSANGAQPSPQISIGHHAEFVCPHTPKHTGRHECYIRTELDKAKAAGAH